VRGYRHLPKLEAALARVLKIKVDRVRQQNAARPFNMSRVVRQPRMGLTPVGRRREVSVAASNATSLGR